MAHILRIDSSIFGQQGQSAQLADQLIKTLNQTEAIAVTHRDLAVDPLPHLTADIFQAFSSNESDLNEAQKEALARSNQAIEELKQADRIVVTAPMYNFTFPSTLKAWMDHVARAGLTFKYTPSGPQGLLSDKPVYVITTRGGQYQGTGYDFQVPLLKQFFGFIGFSDIRVIFAENLARSDAKDDSLNTAKQAIIDTLAV